MKLLPHSFRWRAIWIASCCLMAAIVSIWVLSEYKCLEMRREWDISSTRPDPLSPAITLLDESSGRWTLSIESGNIQFYESSASYTYDVSDPWMPISTHPLSIDWNVGTEPPKHEEWDDSPGFLGFKSEGIVIRLSHRIPGPVRASHHYRHVRVIPLWSLNFAAIVAPTVGYFIVGIPRNRKARARIAQGLCPFCGYDLRAHQPHQKCPECGTQIPTLGWRLAKR